MMTRAEIEALRCEYIRADTDVIRLCDAALDALNDVEAFHRLCGTLRADAEAAQTQSWDDATRAFALQEELWRLRFVRAWELVEREADFQGTWDHHRRLQDALGAITQDRDALAAELERVKAQRGRFPVAAQEKLRPTIQEWTEAIDHHSWHHEQESTLAARVVRLREALESPGGTLEFLDAQASCEEKAYWRLRRWAEKHRLFIDDLGDHRAFIEMAKEAARLLRAALEDDHG